MRTIKIIIFVCFIIPIIFSCDRTTEVKKGDISGYILLEKQMDHSGIIVSIYPAYIVPPEIKDVNISNDPIPRIIAREVKIVRRLFLNMFLTAIFIIISDLRYLAVF